MKKLLFAFLLLTASLQTMAQAAPKSEMRATWLATVYGLDWPNSKITASGYAPQINSQKNAMIRILDSLERANVNAVCFQVRSRSDAMYKSSYEPWSSDLVQNRGMEPGYDPLQFVIEEGHKRGIEVHAWLNPYRFETTRDGWKGQPGDYRETNPEWVMVYSDGKSILDPGQPGVLKQIKSIVGEIVNNYDVDGIIFDDYFYAYGGTPTALDQATQDLFRPADLNVHDWRRANVNRMIAEVNDTIQALKPYVTFGVSPFGIWTTDHSVAAKEGIALPSGISGSNMYAEIYCDPVAWLKEQTVDYISPQLYWTTYSSGQDYDVLCPWWSDLANRFNRHFYSSHSISALTATFQINGRSTIAMPSGESVEQSALSNMERSILLQHQAADAPQPRFGPSEVLLQVDRNRVSDKNGAPGSIFYATKNFYQTAGFINYMRRNVFNTYALVPSINWKKQEEQGLVTNLAADNRLVSWSSPVPNVRYAIYAVPNSDYISPKVLALPDYLVKVTYDTKFTLPVGVSAATHKIAVSIFDRFGNEYAPVVLGESAPSATPTKLLTPSNGSITLLPGRFIWEKNLHAVAYYFEMSNDAQFDQLICSRWVEEESFSTALLSNLQENQTYYWRVRTRFANHVDLLSESREVRTSQFQITSPSIDATDVSLTPTLTWDEISGTQGYLVEIATSSLFESNRILFSATSQSASLTIPEQTLSPSIVYFARISTLTENEDIIRTSPIKFTTLAQASKVPVILSPKNGDIIYGNRIEVSWTEDVAPGYRVELSTTASFPVRDIKVSTTAAYVFQTAYESLAPSNYFIRVKAVEGSGFSANSEVVEVLLSIDTNLEEITNGEIYIRHLQNGNSVVVFRKPIESHTAISLFNAQGVTIYSRAVEFGDEIELPLAQAPHGVYLLEITQENSRKVLKFRKN